MKKLNLIGHLCQFSPSLSGRKWDQLQSLNFTNNYIFFGSYNCHFLKIWDIYRSHITEYVKAYTVVFRCCFFFQIHSTKWNTFWKDFPWHFYLGSQPVALYNLSVILTPWEFVKQESKSPCWGKINTTQLFVTCVYIYICVCVCIFPKRYRWFHINRKRSLLCAGLINTTNVCSHLIHY